MAIIDDLAFMPDSRPYGLSFQTWTEKWWLWLLGIPKSLNPALDATGKCCARDQTDRNVWFLAGTLGGAAKRECTIPAGKAILFPIILDEQSFAERPDFKSESELETLAKVQIDSVKEISAAIDGIQLLDLKKHRVQTRPFDVILPDDNICGIKAGPTRAAADGYWFFLKPMTAGKHTIHAMGRGSHFYTEVTHDLTMVNSNIVC